MKMIRFGWLSCCAAYLMSFAVGIAQEKGKNIELADIFGRNVFSAEGNRHFQFLGDGKHYCVVDDRGNLLERDVLSGKVIDTLLHAAALRTPDGRRLPLTQFSINAAENKVLVHTKVQSIYRNSYTSVPYVIDLKTQEVRPVAKEPVTNVSLDPFGQKVAYIEGNNIFVLDLNLGKCIPLTSDGGDRILNGTGDWVYQESFGIVRAYQWSPDGKKIAYFRFDQSEVPTYSFSWYDAKEGNENYQYRYFRPGESSPKVTVYVYDFESGAHVEMDMHAEGEYYVPRMFWGKDSGTLFLFRMNKAQNQMDFLMADARTGTSRIAYSEHSDTYVDKDVFSNFQTLSGNERMIYMTEKSGWRHLYLLDLKNGREHQLTTGEFDVDRLVSVDERKKEIYYTAASPTPMERQFYVVSLDGKKHRKLSEKSGTYDIAMGKNHSHYLATYSTINTPPIYSIYRADGKWIRDLERNMRLVDTMQRYGISKPTFLKIPNSSGTMLNAWMLLPMDLDAEKKYPVLFANYGGPGSQRVLDKWGFVSFWYQLLAQRGIIVVCVDNSGTGFRGSAFKKTVHGRLGQQEIADQMDAARWLAGHHSYVDKERMGYWGWSFGGYMSALAITLGTDVFKMAISVAPVTDWRYYQSAYTERHMGLLSENGQRYGQCSPIPYVDRVKGDYLLIHGTADDNVHFRHSAMLSEALIKAGKKFTQQYYPDKDHSIQGNAAKIHLYTLMSQFILESLAKNHGKAVVICGKEETAGQTKNRH